MSASTVWSECGEEDSPSLELIALGAGALVLLGFVVLEGLSVLLTGYHWRVSLLWFFFPKLLL